MKPSFRFSRAVAKISRTIRSDSPTHMFRISGPFTCMKYSRMSSPVLPRSRVRTRSRASSPTQSSAPSPQPATAAVGTACHPNVVLEYQSAGVPIVASRVGSIPEALQDGRTGLLAAPGDARDLATRLATLLSDDATRAGLGRAARARAEREFGWDGVATRYQAVLERAIHGAGRVPERTRPHSGASARRPHGRGI